MALQNTLNRSYPGESVGGGGGSVAADTIFDAKGDLPVGISADTAAKLTVGANNTFLVAASAETTGLKWTTSLPSLLIEGATSEIKLKDRATSTSYVHLYSLVEGQFNIYSDLAGGVVFAIDNLKAVFNVYPELSSAIDEAYNATTWNGSFKLVTQNAIRDKIESMGSGVAASTTEVLTGTDTSKFSTPDSLAALWEKGADIISASTISVGEGGFFHVTGTTTITDIDPATDKSGRRFILVFDGILTLTHNASTLILPTGANITTAVGDSATFVSEGSDAVRCVSYTRASGAALAGSGGGNVATDTLFDAKGDLPVGTGTDTAAKLVVGTNNTFLIADSTQTTGLKWGTDLPLLSISGASSVLKFKDRATSATFIQLYSATSGKFNIYSDIAGQDVFTIDNTQAVFNVYPEIASAIDEAYNATTWNGSFKLVTQNAIRDKIESMSGGTAASTTEVLTGTDTAKFVTADALAALWEKGSDISSAATISIGEGGFFHVIGTTTITDIDPATDKAGRVFVLIFDSALVLTHNASTLILPTGANIATAAGDAVVFRSEGSDAVRCISYMRASGSSLTGAGMAIGNTVTSATAGSVLFAGTGPVLAQNNSKLFWDNSTESLHVGSSTFSSSLGGSVEHMLSVNTPSRRAVSAHYFGSNNYHQLTLSGTGKWAVGNFSTLDIQGSPTSPLIIGSATLITSNGTFPVTSSTLYGHYISADIGFPATEAIGCLVNTTSSGSGNSGAVTQIGIQSANLVAHNGTLTSGYAVDAWLASGSSTAGSICTTGVALRARFTVHNNVEVLTAIGLLVGDWAYGGNGAGNIDNSYAIKIDATMDVGTTSKYCIYSSSTSPSVFSGEIQVPDEAYDATGWNADLSVPTKNAVRDQLEVITPVGKQTLWIPASAMIPSVTSGAATGTVETATNDITYAVLDFDATADEHANFNIAFPKSWNEGTITFQVMWASSATDTDGVAWGLQAVAISDNEAIDATWGTPVVVTDDAQSAANELYVTSESSAVTIAGSPAVNDLVFFRIFRDVSDANDDMTEDARLIGVKVFYTVDAGNDN